MKNIVKFIKESVSEINPFYTPITKFNNGDKLILAWINEDDYAEPMNVVVKKHGDDIVFVNADDDRDIKTWKDFINSTDDSFREEKNPQVAVAKNMKQAKDICQFYNNIREM